MSRTNFFPSDEKRNIQSKSILIFISLDYLCVRGVALGVNGSRAESIFYLNHDAGCLETSKMMIESGLCLALQDTELPSTHKGGFMSPATGLGDVLLHRLMNVGVYFESKSFPAPQKQSKL